jgi:hypothetical protein
VVLEFAEFAVKQICFTQMFHEFSFFPAASCKSFPFQTALRWNRLCFSANNSVSFVTSLEKFPARASRFQPIAPKVCNPYHRVEFCGVSPGATAAFHKVINIHVQNFIAQK